VEACYLNAIHDTIDSSFVATMRKSPRHCPGRRKNRQFLSRVYYYSKRDYRRALSHFGACVDSSESASRACAAHAGAYLCAAGLSRYEKADSVLAFIKQEYPAYLEKTMVEKAAAKPLPALKKDSAIKKDAAALLPPDSTASKKSSVKKLSQMCAKRFSHFRLAHSAPWKMRKLLRPSCQSNFRSFHHSRQLW